MGCGLQLGGLLPDLYAFFKQVSLFQLCSRTSSNGTCVRGGQVIKAHGCVPFLPGSCRVNSSWGRGFGASQYGIDHWELFVIHWQAGHHGKQCCFQHISLVWSIIRLASFSCLFFFFYYFILVFFSNGHKYVSAEPAMLASEATHNAAHIASVCRPRLCSSWAVSL